MSERTPSPGLPGSAPSGSVSATAVPDAQPFDDPETASHVDVHVWQLPVRWTHWTIFFSVVVLGVTGFYIGNPVLDASGHVYLMGMARLVHLVAGWAFTAAVVIRVIWMFLGNRWARWDQFVPTTRERRHEIREMIDYYLFRRREPPPIVGHNPLAGMTYLVVFAMFVVQMITGFALAGLARRDGVMWSLTGWVFDLAAIPTVRLVHHLIMWLTIGFVIHHVYSAVLFDFEEKSGMLSSIVSGWKRVHRSRM